MVETDDAQLKRLRIRSWRRGTREMDLILGPFADHDLRALAAAERDHYERLLNENDGDLYAWVSGRIAAPEDYAALIELIRSKTEDRSDFAQPL
ncbi:MAG: succinate dehydrogenase assembly factor 2 [Pseudomonadota bacterium]